MEKTIDVEKAANHLAQIDIVKITSQEMKVSNEIAIKTIFTKSEDNTLEIIEDLKEDYNDLVNHYKKFLIRYES